MKKALRIFGILSVILTVTVMYSCKKDVDNPIEPDQGDTIENLQISPDFKWKTTNAYTVNLTGYANSLASIVNDGKVIARTRLLSDATVSVKIVVPSFVESLMVQYQGQEIELTLDDEVINYIFN